MQGYADAVPPDRRVRLGKPQPKKFASYLRILDFDTVGETDGVIGECCVRATTLRTSAAQRCVIRAMQPDTGETVICASR